MCWDVVNLNKMCQDLIFNSDCLFQVGLEVHHGVCILGFNSPEWFISDLAAIVAGYLSFSTLFLPRSELKLHDAKLNSKLLRFLTNKKLTLYLNQWFCRRNLRHQFTRSLPLRCARLWGEYLCRGERRSTTENTTSPRPTSASKSDNTVYRRTEWKILKCLLSEYHH